MGPDSFISQSSPAQTTAHSPESIFHIRESDNENLRQAEMFYIGDHSYITSALVGGEGGQKMPNFADS